MEALFCSQSEDLRKVRLMPIVLIACIVRARLRARGGGSDAYSCPIIWWRRCGSLSHVLAQMHIFLPECVAQMRGSIPGYGVVSIVWYARVASAWKEPSCVFTGRTTTLPPVFAELVLPSAAQRRIASFAPLALFLFRPGCVQTCGNPAAETTLFLCGDDEHGDNVRTA